VKTPAIQHNLSLPGLPTTVAVNADAVIGEMLRRASSPGFDDWWRRVASVGFCAHPIQLAGTDAFGRQQRVWTRCNNRRTSVCPSCSALYARDTWQLVHAGAAGGHHDIPATVSAHPQVFATLTAPSFGPVHGSTGTVCCTQHPGHGGRTRCPHGKPLWCNMSHHRGDEVVGQPLCGDCYDYLAHVVFTWQLPELWRRFTIALRRAVRQSLKTVGADPDSVRVSFVKVVEMQARAVPHIHALIRLDPANIDPADTNTTDADLIVADSADAGTTGSGEHADHGHAATCGGGEPRHPAHPPWQPPISAADLAALIHQAARQINITITDPSPGPDLGPGDPNAADAATAVLVVRFGTQIDTQPVTATPRESADADHVGGAGGLSARRVARYLAKYVTKSLHDFGIAARRLSAASIATLDVTDHIRAILATVAELAEYAATHPRGGSPWAGIGRWLHTLGYRGHITTKSRTYSTTMTALRNHRAEWTRQHTTDAKSIAEQYEKEPERDVGDWSFDRAGHATLGDRVLAVSASLRQIATRLAGLDHSHRTPDNDRWAVPDG